MARPISVIDSEEVLLARIACPGVQASSSPNTVLLDLHPLGHRLDHEVDVAEALVVGRAGDQAQRVLELLLGLLLVIFSFFDEALELALGDLRAPSRAPGPRTSGRRP